MSKETIKVLENASTQGQPKRTRKRKTTTKWTKQIALKALDLEEQYHTKLQYNKTFELVIQFPDPEITDSIVKSFSNSIQEVDFHSPIEPRECVVKLDGRVNINKAMKEIGKVRFGNGRLKVRRKLSKEQKLRECNPEDVDPFTIYFGNLPFSKIPKLKNIFSMSDVELTFGSNKRKPKSFAFAKFKTFEDAVRGFRKCTERFPPDKFVIIRFKRNKKTSVVDANEQILSSTVISNSNEQNSNDSIDEWSDNQEEEANLEQIQEKAENTEEIYDPNKEIKIEPELKNTFLGFNKNTFDDDDLDGDTDCSGSTYRCSNSIGSDRRRSHSSDISVLAISDTDDGETNPPIMKKPKLLVLPKILHGAMREIKNEKNDEDDDDDDDIGNLGDLDFI